MDQDIVRIKSADMPKPSLQDEAAEAYLALFDNDISQAIAGLQQVNQAKNRRQKKHPVVASDALVIVELSSVAKTYKLGKQKVEALKDVSLQIRQGEFIAITGTSGSGKSTLLQLIGGLDKPTSGVITVNGQNIGKLSDRKLSMFRNQTIGFVFQFFYLQPFLKLQANLEVPGMFARTKRAVRATRAQELAKIVGLDERLNHFPKELSGGQMQRAAIARALLNQPKLLLADEPTGNLDSTNSTAIIEQFEAVRHDYGTTIIVVTHDATIAQRADREIVMKDGVIIG